ncbi:hypothetical protein MMC12_003987 [Toensbergia leucococca]|nr:hypothetical protein [Toensbergia leucococca]
MSKATPPTDDLAPSYEEIYHNHPVNQTPPSSSATAYASVAQDDDLSEHELESRSQPHQHPRIPDELPFRADRSIPHVHCEACDSLYERKAKRTKEMRCCQTVAATFVAAFVCMLVAGITIVKTVHS